MLAGFMRLFSGRPDPKRSARDAIVTLRQQLQMIEKKEEYLQKKIDGEMAKARANAVANKPVALAALKRKKANEEELDRLGGTRLQLEIQVNTLESANLNAETLMALKKATNALQDIHSGMSITQVDDTMVRLVAQKDLADEIAAVISTGNGSREDDEYEYNELLDKLVEEDLNDRLNEAEHVPATVPDQRKLENVPDDEEMQLRDLQQALAM